MRGPRSTGQFDVPTHLAIIDDDADITRLLADYLQAQGFRVTRLHTGAGLMDLMERDPPALALLDLGLPDEDGIVLARRLRARSARCGLVIVTGRGDEIDRVVGLEIGADDYITKPLRLRELLARVRAVLRRLEPPASEPASPHDLHFARWNLDIAGRRLVDDEGQEVSLTTGEFELLRVFTGCAGRVLSRDFLLEHTRGRGAAPFDRTIDVQVGRLRRKLEVDPEHPQIIKSVRGAGYVLATPVVPSDRHQ